MNEQIIFRADQYDRVDGRNAYRSNIKRLTLGKTTLEENEVMKIAATMWKQGNEGTQEALAELPMHQVLDLAILICRTLEYFQEAYRFPLLYNPENPIVERVGVQGGVLPIEVCIDNPSINQDIQEMSRAISDQGELLGERLRILAHILDEMGY